MPIDDQLFGTPENANEALYDAMVRHQIYLQRVSGGLRKQIEKLLNDTEQEIADRIRGRLLNSDGLTSSIEVRRLETLLGMLKRIRGEAWEKVGQTWQDELTAIAKHEPELMASMVTTSAPVVVQTVLPETGLLKAIVKSKPFEGKTLKEWSKSVAAEDIRRIEAQIRLGMVAGESSSDIARRVVGTARLKGTDGVTEISRRNAAAITRTAVNQVTNEARAEFFKANSDLFEEEQYVSTLDSRTTAVCRAYDGQRFEIGRGPIPPLHFNCRSLRVPVLDGELLGSRPQKPTTEKMLLKEYGEKNGLGAITKRQQLPRGTRGDFDKFARGRVRELTGQTPSSTTYQQWLGRQSKSFQDEVLGKTKARLFRDGGLQLDKFVNRAGDELTLSQLAQKHAEAFTAAGLDPSEFN